MMSTRTLSLEPSLGLQRSKREVGPKSRLDYLSPRSSVVEQVSLFGLSYFPDRTTSQRTT